MASPRLEAGFATLNVNSSNDTRPHESDIEPTRNLADPESQCPSPVCQWRTTRFYDQECSRFFDCPSHLVERRFSEDNTGYEPYMLPELSNRDIADPAIVGDNTDDMDNVQTSPVHPQDRELPPIPYSPSADPHTGLWRTASASSSTRRGSQPGIFRQTSRNLGETPAGDQYRSDGQSRANRRSVIITEPTEAVNALHRSRTHGNTDSGRRSAAHFAGRRQSRDTAGDSQDSGDEERSTDFVLPRWQPDAEVTYCPICHNQFSIFVRKHHCRKCGRVVCASCSPHRIIIPHQYIVRAPGYELPASQNLLLDGLVASYGLSGGERVRLCNPCVPDPNIAPPHSPSSVRNSHSRSHNGTTRVHGGHGRYPLMHTPSEGLYSDRYYTPRTRSVTMLPPAPGSGSGGTSRSSRHAAERYRSGSFVSAAPSSYPARIGSLSGAPSSSRRRALPPRPHIAEEDECPVCHQELPSRTLPDFEALREDHITSCILEHSQYGNSPRRASTSDRGESGGEASSLAAPRRTGMYTYPATEKDCVDDAECTICLEEFTVGVPMARLECLCRFHRSCIAAWFVNHPGRCPVHQHDGFGY